MLVSLIAAVATNGVIGRDGELPWRLPDDLRFFKQVTMRHHLIMGRRTWASIGRPLPGRTMIVLSRQDISIPGIKVAHDLPEAFALAEDASETEAFIIGGAEVYAQALHVADRIYLTRVHADVEGDASFPVLEGRWIEVARREHAADDAHAHAFSICTLVRAT